jgi:exodeoxyribonuclease-3
MKLLTYNILSGGKQRLISILRLINLEKPDFLAIQEASEFDKNNSKLLKRFAKDLGFPYFNLSPSAKYDYHTASFSKYPFIKATKLPLIQNSALITLSETPIGNLTVCNAHLCPGKESERLQEIKKILPYLQLNSNVILVGDMNSLSPHDKYPKNIINKFNQINLEKFTRNNKLITDAISTIESSGLIDVAVHLKKNQIHTVPTRVNLPELFSIPLDQPQLRLDYIFVSKPLIGRISNYKVIRGKPAQYASDHYPIAVTFNK